MHLPGAHYLVGASRVRRAVTFKFWTHPAVTNHNGWVPPVWPRHLIGVFGAKLSADRLHSTQLRAPRDVKQNEKVEAIVLARTTPDVFRRLRFAAG